jgi:hypothetical protein
VGKKKTAGRCIVSAPHAHQRTTDSGKRGGGASQVEGGSGDRGGRRLPGGSKWPGGPNATWAGAERKQKNKKKRWAARTTGPKWFLAALRKRKKKFSDFDSRNNIQI